MNSHLILLLYFFAVVHPKEAADGRNGCRFIKTVRLVVGKKGDTREEQIRLLRKFRFGLLEEIHGKQQELDQVDYLIHEIKEEENPI